MIIILCNSGSLIHVYRVWNEFRQLMPLLTNKDISLIVRGRLYSSCVQSSMLHGSETWPIRKENEVALQWAEMTVVRWMCGIKLKDRHTHTHNRFTALLEYVRDHLGEQVPER